MQNENYEKQILGAIKERQELIDDFNITDKLFLNPLNKKFFEIMRNIHIDGKTIDPLLVFDKIQGTEIKDKISYFDSLETFYSSNAEYYIMQQKEFIKLKELEMLQYFIKDWINEKKDSSEIVNLIDNKITNLLNTGNNNLVLIKDCLYDVIKEIEECYKLGGRIKGLCSGFSQLDFKLNGFNDELFYIIGARPSQGKTALILNIMRSIAKQEAPVGFLSCETPRNMLIKRLLAIETQVNSLAIRSGNLKNREFSNLTTGFSVINDYKIWIDDTCNMNLSYIKTQSRRMARGGIKIIFLDYIGLVQHENKKIPRWEQVGEISRACKNLARELKIPFVVLSQLRRETETKKPTLADLRETGDLEADADCVMLLHKERQKQDVEIIIAKNRDGATGSVNTRFNPETLTFYEIENKE